MPRFLRSDTGYCAAVFALGFLLSWLPLVLTPPGVGAVDEVFQYMEAGHRLAFGYGAVPWEFDYQARSWMLGALSALPMAAAGLAGAGPQVYLPLTWALFSLPAAGAILCAGLWGRRAFGAAGGVAVALVAASWIDNLAFGGRVLSETVSAHLLIIAVWLAEPGHAVESRKRLALAGLLATLAVLLRLQLGPAALLLWLWRWRDRRRLLLLSAGAVLALLADGAFDAVTVGWPFQPLWQNLRFNLLLHGAAVFGEPPWYYYFDESWKRWGFTAAPFLLLAMLGGRRQKLLLAMTATTVAVHLLIAHQEYRFLLPAVMMAAILCGLGAVEAALWLADWLARRWRPAATASLLLAGTGWTGLAIANAMTLDAEGLWRTQPALLDMVTEVSRQPGLCGLGFGNLIAYSTGGYTFLHRRVPTYYSLGPDQRAFIRLRPAFNAFIIRVGDMPFFDSLGEFGDYALDHCNNEVCLFIRRGGCTAMAEPRPPIVALSARVALDPRYPYAVGIEGRK